MKIVASSPLQEADDKLFLTAIEQIVSKLVPPSIKSEIEAGSLRSLFKSLPLIQHSTISRTVSITTLCPSPYTHGVGRYLNDTLSRWLVPGKILPIMGVASLNFSFEKLLRHQFYVHHVLLDLESVEDIETAVHQMPKLVREIILNIQAVYRARYLASLRSISSEQKQQLIEQHLKSFLQPESSSVFDEMQHVLQKLSGEQTVQQATQAMRHLAQSRPKFFDRETFYEMTRLTTLLSDQFTANRTPQHISRVVALHYLFKKTPSVQLKVFPVKQRSILCICLGYSREIDLSLLQHAVRLCLPSATLVEHSILSDSHFYYLEVTQPQFSPAEITRIRSHLTDQIAQLLERQDRLASLPRNEEDVARNLILLSHELHAKTDSPQVIIHYEKHTRTEIVFSVLLVRLLLSDTPNLRQRIASHRNGVKFVIDELRSVGKLKQKTVKEGAVLSATVEKKPFVRADGSVHFLAARQQVAENLTHLLGSYRDFNGGMIIRQEQTLRELRELIGPVSQETSLLLESYFYSLRPGMLPAVLPVEVLKAHFLQLLELQRMPEKLFEETAGEFVLFFLSSSDKDHLDLGIEKLNIHRIFNCAVSLHKQTAVGYLVRPEHAASVRNILSEQQLSLAHR